MPDTRLIETDRFSFEFLSRLAERESWRKEIHRPIYHIHKWWAKRLGSVFRGILLGSAIEPEANLADEFYRTHSFSNLSVLDPFMGSGTTIGEAHKLGFTALGRDINPVAVNATRVALGALNQVELEQAFAELSRGVGKEIRALYEAKDSEGRPCEVLYYFWVMQAPCSCCSKIVDLFPSYVIARNAYPNRKPVVQVVCSACGDVFPHDSRDLVAASCPSCGNAFDTRSATAKGSKARCRSCDSEFSILNAIDKRRPGFRLYAKLVLNWRGQKEYLPATALDKDIYDDCSRELKEKIEAGQSVFPKLELRDGHNTRQAMSYGFRSWLDFFNDRQLLALGLLHRAIRELPNAQVREALLVLFSGALEFNNMFASYKGEGTGAVRHMFSHHILKPERTPIEGNVWGTPKSSGSFSNLFRSRLIRAIAYRRAPSEVSGGNPGPRKVCSPPFTGDVAACPNGQDLAPRGIYLSCGDSCSLGLADKSIDLVVTDPPFFDNVHYSELADFFYSWQQLGQGTGRATTRHMAEVQDTDAGAFASKLRAVLRDCARVLKDHGLLVFTYHHSREDGWRAVADALLNAGYFVVNAHPIKSEMSVATPKSQAKEPIQLDIILVCRKAEASLIGVEPNLESALASANRKLGRLEPQLKLSLNDRRVVLYGQALTTLRTLDAFDSAARWVDRESLRLQNEQLGRGQTSELADLIQRSNEQPVEQLVLW